MCKLAVRCHPENLMGPEAKLYRGSRIKELDACGLALDACALELDACRLMLEACGPDKMTEELMRFCP